jgi:phosphatidylserine decarboxylase
MENSEPFLLTGLAAFCVPLGAYFFWRYLWFFRNPDRRIPDGDNIISPADGTVVYVEKVAPREPVISVKKKRKISVCDIVREDLEKTRILIGIFMSPFDVHYNRAPIAGEVAFIRHHSARRKNLHMGSMHWRSLFKYLPIYGNSPHIFENERTVTKINGPFRGELIPCYVVQIAGGSVSRIESSVCEGSRLEKGDIFGMIRMGSQVDVVVPYKTDMRINVAPGDKVRAGTSILIM